jgi:hypothetical protein
MCANVRNPWKYTHHFEIYTKALFGAARYSLSIFKVKRFFSTDRQNWFEIHYGKVVPEAESVTTTVMWRLNTIITS